MSKKQLVSRIRTLMKQRGFSVRGLVAVTGLSDQTIQRARSDAKVGSCTLSTLQAIANALGCEVKDLFEETVNQDSR